jgi:hypothetical protein
MAVAEIVPPEEGEGADPTSVVEDATTSVRVTMTSSQLQWPLPISLINFHAHVTLTTSLAH